MENEFYKFARNQFRFVKQRTLTYNADRIVGARPEQFYYNDIFPL